MRDFLIIARVGDTSLHSEWLDGPRNWDIALSCFGKRPPARAEECVLVEQATGPKWPPLHAFIERNADLIARYRHVMLPDDDLRFTAAAISRFFALCARHGFAIAQPSLDYQSYYSHPITVRRPLLSFRETDFVEVMTPCFRQDILRELLPSLLASASGWGIDDLWPRLLAGRGERFAVVDEVSVTHTRPVGGELYRGDALRHSPFRDYEDIHAAGVARVSRRVSYGCTRSGLRVPRPVVRALGLLTRLHRKPDGQAAWRVTEATPAR